MNNILVKVKALLKNNKKKIIKGGIIICSTGIIILGACGFGFYKYVTSNINYTQSEAESIALGYLSGEVVNTKIEIDDGILEYEVQIKDNKNMLKEVTICSKTGAIVDIDK